MMSISVPLTRAASLSNASRLSSNGKQGYVINKALCSLGFEFFVEFALSSLFYGNRALYYKFRPVFYLTYPTSAPLPSSLVTILCTIIRSFLINQLYQHQKKTAVSSDNRYCCQRNSWLTLLFCRDC